MSLYKPILTSSWSIHYNFDKLKLCGSYFFTRSLNLVVIMFILNKNLDLQYVCPL